MPTNLIFFSLFSSPLAHSNHSLNDAMNLKIKEKLLSLDELSKSNNLDSKQVVEALKNRIRDLEAETTGSKFICLICKVIYTYRLSTQVLKFIYFFFLAVTFLQLQHERFTICSINRYLHK